MRALIFVPDQDTAGKRDMSAAFLPEARAFAKHLGCVPEEVIKRFPANASLDQRRATCTLAIKDLGVPVDVIAFYCHGWKAGIQAGFLKQHGQVLARLMQVHAKPTSYILLYACEAGRDMDPDEVDDRDPGPGGDGGFADTLRDSCEVLGLRVTVMAHATAGHCGWNPYARRFAPGQGGKGGDWFVAPNSPLWRRWVSSMRDPRSTLRYRFWYMTSDEIADELRAGPGTPPPRAAA